MGSRRRVDPPAGQISSGGDSKDLFAYLSHHGERSSAPVPICDHSRRHFEPQRSESARFVVKPRRPAPVPQEHGQGKKIFPDARNETEEIIKPRRERPPEKPQAPEKPQGARHVEPIKHENIEWGTETKISTHGAFHAEAFPGSIGYNKFPDHDPATGKLIDYCLRDHGGPFGRRKLHQNQPLPVAPVSSVAPIPPRPITPVQNWHPFTDVKPPPPNKKLQARLEQSAIVAASMTASIKSSSDSGPHLGASSGSSRPESVPKFNSQLFSQGGRGEKVSRGDDSGSAAPAFNPKIHMQFNANNTAPSKMMPELVPASNWNFLGGYRPPNRKK